MGISLNVDQDYTLKSAEINILNSYDRKYFNTLISKWKFNDA